MGLVSNLGTSSARLIRNLSSAFRVSEKIISSEKSLELSSFECTNRKMIGASFAFSQPGYLFWADVLRGSPDL